MASIKESRSWPLDPCCLKHSRPGMGLVVPSPPALIPADRLTAAAATTASTSELLELHIRLEWVRRSSGREQTDTDHHTAQPSPALLAQQKKVKSQGNKRGGKLGVDAPPLFGGRVVPPKLPTTPLWARVLEPWKLGRFGRRQSVNNREPSNRPIAPVQQQSAATIRQATSNQQPAGKQWHSQALAATHYCVERKRHDQHLRPAPLHLLRLAASSIFTALTD